MKWIILITDENVTLDDIINIKHTNCTDAYDTNLMGRYAVTYGDDYIFYDYDNSIVNDFEEEEICKIPFTNPHFIMMSYSSKNILLNILSQDNFLKNIYIYDNDDFFGKIEDYIKIFS